MYFVCSFSLLAQRKRTKRKGSRSLGSLSANNPSHFQKRRALRNSLRSDSPRAFFVFFKNARLREMAS
jgi:hypothetical protein